VGQIPGPLEAPEPEEVAMRARVLGVSGLAAALLLAAPARSQEVVVPEGSEERPLRASIGASFTTGDYGQDDDTDILYVPFALRYEADPVVLRLTVPYIRIRGPGDVVGGTEGAVIVGSGAGGRETNDGLGDVVASATYVLYPSNELPVFELTGKVKFPTADEDEGLGTGEYDFTVELDASKAFGRLTPFATLGYRFLGDPPGADLDDVLFASLGLGVEVSPRFDAGLVYDWSQTASGGVEDAHELVPYLVWKLAERVRLNAYGIAGLSEGAADWGGGLSLGVDF
jgi:hypothetical protein